MDTNKGIIAWFARNSVAANLLMIILLLAGLGAVLTIKKQAFPEIQLEQVNIRVPYLGAAPQEVESGVIDKIEESIRGVNGIKRIRSTAVEGLGTVVAEIASGYDIQEVMEEIKTQVNSISTLPEQTERPVVYRIRFQSNVLWLSLFGDATEQTLKELAKQIRDEIKKQPGVSKVDVVAARNYEVAVEIPEHRLREYGLTFEQVVSAIRGSSVDLPGGSIRSESGNILLRTKGQAYYQNDFDNIVLVKNADGTRLLLSDIATVTDGFIERARLATFNGQNSVSIRIDAVGEDDTLRIAETVKQYVEKKRTELPPSVSLDYWGDSSYYLQGRLDLMTDNLLMGVLLVLIALTLFLEFRIAFWVMVGIPVCFLGALAMLPLPFFDVSINMISLFGFILVLGIVVDDAIIIGESAYSEIEKRGKSTDAVIAGAKKVAMPATFGVLTTIAAFVPMLMVGGAQSAIWGSIAWVVVLCLTFSIIESKLILPAHIANMDTKPWDPDKGGIYALGRFGSNSLKKIRGAVSRGLNNFIEQRYRPLIEKCIEFRYVTMAAFFAMLILMFGVMSAGFVRWVFFPDVPNDFMQATVQMEEGASNEATVLAIKEIEAALMRVDQQLLSEGEDMVVKHRLVFLNSDTAGQIVVELDKSEGREVDSFEIGRRWREQIPEIPGLKAFKLSNSGFGGGADIALQLRGTNLDNLQKATAELKLALAAYEGVFDIEDNLLGGNDEIVLALKPEADLMGITLADLARQVRYGFYGAEAQRIQRNGEEIKVMVRYPREERRSIGDLENMRIRTANGGEVPFSQIATYTLQPSFSAINRVNGERAVTITAAADKARIEPGKVVAEVRRTVIKELEQKYPGVTGELDGASQDEMDAQRDLMKAAVFALFCIYALMAVPLKSYAQPLIIMSVIPFGLIGAVIGHMVLGLSMSIMSVFGLVALAGVVVNDSLIMVDFVNRARAEGVAIKQAVVQAGTQRFRAILLTSLTTFVGLAPIVLERSLQAKIVIPMAVSLAFGILFATVITLVLIPALYVMLEDVKKFMPRAIQSFSFVLKNYLQYKGRDNQARFWTFWTLKVLVLFGLVMVFTALPWASWLGYSWLSVLKFVPLAYAIAISIPTIAAMSRRLHDANLSGWWLLLLAIPLLGYLIVLCLAMLPTSSKAERFGVADEFALKPTLPTSDSPGAEMAELNPINVK
ncbi:RND family efflux transporter [Alishewanella agri BL06]|uniref:RND family efflux transporter n=1 Tax=Alishewanella agri BL06 TaxID=1195246 RepID=I9DWA9_9ALTE|nr:efflux RND transporter permease subunit [Alishewanella agri]EIW90490.1 RND family efflux transporter [Alishewanella agri BL06]